MQFFLFTNSVLNLIPRVCAAQQPQPRATCLAMLQGPSAKDPHQVHSPGEGHLAQELTGTWDGCSEKRKNRASASDGSPRVLQGMF